MAARGTIGKQEIFDKLKEVFPNAFMADAKIMRIPIMEDGEVVEIKVQLTAAKDILGSGDTPASPAAAASKENESMEMVDIEPTEEEKETIKAFLGNMF